MGELIDKGREKLKELEKEHEQKEKQKELEKEHKQTEQITGSSTSVHTFSPPERHDPPTVAANAPEAVPRPAPEPLPTAPQLQTSGNTTNAPELAPAAPEPVATAPQLQTSGNTTNAPEVASAPASEPVPTAAQIQIRMMLAEDGDPGELDI